jgi:meiotic recombination protein SPO11
MLLEGANLFDCDWVKIRTDYFNNTRSASSLKTRWKIITQKIKEGNYHPSPPVTKFPLRLTQVRSCYKQDIRVVSELLASVLSDTSSVSPKRYASFMTEMVGMVDLNNRSMIIMHDNVNCIDAKQLSQLLGRNLCQLEQQKRSPSLVQRKTDSSIHLPESTTSTTSKILDSNLSDDCQVNADNQCEQWNDHLFMDETFLPVYEDKADDAAEDNDQNHLSAKLLMGRERIWTVFADLSMGIMARQECIIRSYAHPQQHEPEDNHIPHISRNFFNLKHSTSFISIVKLLAYIYELLRTNQSITCRALYYFFKDWFGQQCNCIGAINLACKILMMGRCSLGIIASSKGWFCGSFEISRKGTLLSGQKVDEHINGTSMELQGKSITHEWIDRDENGITKDGIEIKVFSKDAKVILVIEHEGVYQRLSEDRIFDQYPCILISGKGFPDLATRALVHSLHRELQIPVVGVADCDPFGISVICTYFDAGERMGIDGGRRYSVPIKFVGLLPSQVDQVKNNLRPDQLQVLDDRDMGRIDWLLNKTCVDHCVVTHEVRRELMYMLDKRFKVSLDALRSIRHDYMTTWIVNMLKEI